MILWSWTCKFCEQILRSNDSNCLISKPNFQTANHEEKHCGSEFPVVPAQLDVKRCVASVLQFILLESTKILGRTARAHHLFYQPGNRTIVQISKRFQAILAAITSDSGAKAHRSQPGLGTQIFQRPCKGEGLLENSFKLQPISFGKKW